MAPRQKSGIAAHKWGTRKGAPEVMPGASSARVATAPGCVSSLSPRTFWAHSAPEEISLPLVLIGLKEGELPVAKVTRA